jgi:hypothetical protein
MLDRSFAVADRAANATVLSNPKETVNVERGVDDG